MMDKFLLLISIILIIYFQNPIVSLILGLSLGFILQNDLKKLVTHVGSLPLQNGIILMGFSISFKTLSDLVINYFPIISIFAVTTFLIGLLIGKLFKLEKNFIYLISSATAICGVTAALTISTIIKAKPNQVSLAIFIIFLMNAFALALFPFIGRFLGLSDIQFGLFSALAIHDTASVVGSGLLFSNYASEVAATLKIGRTIWLLPLIACIGYLENAQRSIKFDDFPKFIIFFFFAILLTNTFSLPNSLHEALDLLSVVLINIGIFFIALQSKIKPIKNIKSLSYPLLLWAVVVLISFLVVTGL
tara:strand:+ start:79 stop:990 length:912 start_codon:yes stop_codon:yes gene_type:complete